MVKNCTVLINNEAVTVIDYDGVSVQIPSVHKNTKTVRVAVDNGRYTVVDNNYTEPMTEFAAESATKSKRKTAKKTTLDENAKGTENAENEHINSE